MDRSEWIGGTFSLAAWRKGGVAFRSQGVLWLGGDRRIVGLTALPPGDADVMAADNLLETIWAPAVGEPRMPMQLRVASARLAAELEQRLGMLVKIVVAPTPELDAVVEQLGEHLVREEDASGGLDELDEEEADEEEAEPVSEKTMGRVFRAAAALYRAAPWAVIPSDSSILSLSIPELGIKDMVLSVIGQAGESFGILLFPSIGVFLQYLQMAERLVEGREPSAMVDFLALSFRQRADLDPQLRRYIDRQGWEVEGPGAYPELIRSHAGLVEQGPTAAEARLIEAVALGLSRLVHRRRPKLEQAWQGGGAVRATYKVEIEGGKVRISFRAPHPAWS